MTIDCRDVAFMDSTGLSVLVRVLRDASDDGRAIRFLGASTPVQHLLEATGVDQWMSALGVRSDA
jgi:anti-anti-sigma factor